MGIVIALVFIAAVVLLVTRLRPGTRERDAGSAVAVDSAEWVTLRSAMPRTEAPIARALLESNGITTLMERAPNGLAFESPADATFFRLAVAREDYERALELLG